MNSKLSIRKDVQQDPPLTYCDRCKSEIYGYDPVGDLEGTLVHLECMTEEEEAWSRIALAYSFF